MATPLRRDLKPKVAKILTTSAPDRTLSLGMHQRLKFEASQDRRIVCQTEVGGVLTLQLESYRFPQILCQFVQRFPLGNHGQIEALGDELALASEDVNLDDFLHLG